MFEVHKLNDVGMVKATELQQAFKEFLVNVEAITGTGGPVGAREMAIVRSNLEVASFYAKRAMAMHPAHHTEVIG